MKILLTGSSGMLGSDVCKVFTASHEIIGVDLINTQYAGCKLQVFHQVDITDLEKIKEVFDKEKPDIVIHTAAWADVDGCEKDPEKAYKINTEGTHNIAKVSVLAETPVIFISTDFVFDGKKNSLYTEGDIANPISVYGKSKWEAEKILQDMLTHYAIVRTSWLYGKHGKNFVETIITKGTTEGKLKVVNDQIGCPTYTKDLAVSLKRLVEDVGLLGGEIYHISNKGRCSWYEFASEILKIAKFKKVIIMPITSVELARPATRPCFSVLDNGKFETAAGQIMRTWQEAVVEYINKDLTEKNENVF